MVKALKSMFGSDNATWMVVGVVVVILIIVVVCYFGKNRNTVQPRYIQKFTVMPERFTERFANDDDEDEGEGEDKEEDNEEDKEKDKDEDEDEDSDAVKNGKPCTTNEECGGDGSEWSCFDNQGGTKEGYCAKRCESSSECKPNDSKKYHEGNPTTCRGNDKNCKVRGYCVPESVEYWNEKCCASSSQCNSGYDCRGNDLETNTLGKCVMKCEDDEDCPGKGNKCDNGRCVKNNECKAKCAEGFSNYYEHFTSSKHSKTAPKKPTSGKAPVKKAPLKKAPVKKASVIEKFYGGYY